MRPDVLILTALNDEYSGLVERIEARDDTEMGTEIPGLIVPTRAVRLRSRSGRHYELAIACAPRMAATAAAAVASALLREMHPTALAMCGVCAGDPRRSATGDVIVGERFFPFDAGKRVGSEHQQDYATYNITPQWKMLAERIGPIWASRFPSRPPTLEFQERTLLRKLWEAEQNDLDISASEISMEFNDWPAILRRLMQNKLVQRASRVHLLWWRRSQLPLT